MTRPRKRRCLRHKIRHFYFKPQGVPLRQLQEINLLADELEAIKLHDLNGLSQIEAAKKMNISQPTLARTLRRAYKKITLALIEGRAIRIERSKH